MHGRPTAFLVLPTAPTRAGIIATNLGVVRELGHIGVASRQHCGDRPAQMGVLRDRPWHDPVDGIRHRLEGLIARGLGGKMYDDGRGVPQDNVTAYKWLNLATTYADASQREEYAEARDAVAERLTPEQRAEGQKLAREWFAAHPREP